MNRTLFLLLIAAACSKQQPKAAPPAIQQHVQLRRAASCASLTASVQDTAVQQMRAQLDQEKDNVITWGGVPMADGGAAGTPSAAGAAPASYTTTNTQVAGVDEADFVKNDGTRIFVLSGNSLFAAKSWPPQDLALAGKVQIEGWPQSMFLDGDRVVVFSSIWSQTPSGMPCPMGAMCAMGSGVTKITVVGVGDLTAPVVQSEVYLPGYSDGARRVGSSVRLVLSDSVRWPEKVRFWPDYSPGLYDDKAKLIAAIDALENQNEAIIRSTPIEAWFPYGQRKLPGKLVDVAYQCSDFFLSNASERLGLVTIATLDLDHLDKGVSRSSLVAEPGVVYATREHLYVASQHWWWWTLSGQREYTYVHEFDLTDPATAGYLASGGVDGIVGDQFSMDEKDGYLRIATSTIYWLEDPKTPHSFHTQVSSQLNVLGAKGDGTLAVVGGINPLVDGERLMATRFTGDSGYAVTFRYVDPLVTLDLSDPAHPRKVAELTLPGFSTYLQPIDGRHLLAIGEELPLDGAGHPDWSRRSVELSLFDVSDLAHPLRTAQALVGTAWAYSEALWDHHAFNWYQPDPAKPGLLAIPFSDWTQGAEPWWNNFVSDVRVFSVDAGRESITPAGSLGMNDVYVQYGSGQWTWWYRPWVRRSVMATDTTGKTFVYAVSDAGIRSAALGSLTSPLATALFPHN